MKRSIGDWKISLLRPSEIDFADIESWRTLQGAHEHYGSPHLGASFAGAMERIDPSSRVLLAHDSAGSLKFVLPLCLRRNGFSRAIGAPFCDYSGPILAPDFSGDIGTCLARAGLSAFRMNATPDPFGHLAAYRAAADTGFRVLTSGRDGAVLLEALRAANPKFHKNIRRLRNRMEREFRSVRLVAGAPDPVPLEQLFRWKRDQYIATGRLDVFATREGGRVIDSFLKLKAGPCQGYQLLFYCNETLVAGEFGFLADSTFHPWIAAYDRTFESLAPGHQLMREMIQCIDSLGLLRYDLGVGHADYKKYFCDVQVPVWSGLITARSFSGGSQALREAGVRMAAIGPVAAVATRMRNRFDHIAACETRVGERIRLALQAIRQGLRRGGPPGSQQQANEVAEAD
jgi:CelD/BcsL family acetyltransferase involved in cellulose biosynthesis